MILYSVIASGILQGQSFQASYDRLREELRRTMTNSSLSLAQAQNEKEVQRIYEKGFGELDKIISEASGFELKSKDLNQKAQFAILRLEALGPRLTDSKELEKIAKVAIETYRDSSACCKPLEELFFYKLLPTESHSRVESWFKLSKNREVQASSELARIFLDSINLTGDPNRFQTFGAAFRDTAAGRRATQVFDLRSKLALGLPMPDMSISLLGGQSVKLSALKGKVVILHFWGFWNGTSVSEIVELRNLQREHEGKLQIIGINTDDWNGAFLNKKIKDAGINWPNHQGFHPASTLPLNFGVTEYPTKFVVDQTGIIRKVPGFGNWRQVVDELLKI